MRIKARADRSDDTASDGNNAQHAIFWRFEAERGNAFHIDMGGVPLDVIGDGGKTATKFQMEYFVEDERVAEIVAIGGNRIYMRAKSTGATLLTAKTSDGQTAYAKIFVRHIPQTTTTACSREIVAP